MTFRIINSDGRGFCVEADDDTDPLAQMFVGKPTVSPMKNSSR
jgi:hypothetical protein